MKDPQSRPLVWIGSSRKDISGFPEDVRRRLGFARYRAQHWETHIDAKPLRGFQGASVLEVVEDLDGSTYRGVYTVRFRGVVYVLHVFQKKSKRDIATPPTDIKLIKERLKRAREIHLSVTETRP